MVYVKLFGSILASTIWGEDQATRIVWITMLAMADRDGVVSASVPGLAHMAQVGVGECRSALKCLLAPDPESRTKDYEGRRIAVVEGGWVLLNYEYYRDKASAEEKRLKDAARQKRKYMRDNPDSTSRKPHAAHGDSPDLTKPRLSSDLTSGSTQLTLEGSLNPASDDTSGGKKKQKRSAPAKQPEDVTDDTWEEWTAHRRRKSASVSVGVLRTARERAKELGMPLETLLAKWTFSGQQGCYVTNDKPGGGPKTTGPKVVEPDFNKIDYGKTRKLQ